VQVSVEQHSGPLDGNEMQHMRRLVDVIEATGTKDAPPP
jgi:hypothetical protein